MKNFIYILLLLCVSFAFNGCKDFELPEKYVTDQTSPDEEPKDDESDEDGEDGEDHAAAGTITIADVSTATATLKYNSEYADKVIFHYISANGTKYTFDGVKDEYTFIAKLPMLKANTTYTCFAEVDGRRTKEESFTTKPHAIAEPVDLGLGVKWASWNVGATSTNEPGGLYGYSDITETQFSTNTYDYSSSDIWGGTKDIARVKWGKNWRMPTESEMRELKNKCEWIWKETYYEVVGPNGNSIYLPICGYREGSSTRYTYLLYYWTGDSYLSSYGWSGPYYLYSNDNNAIGMSYEYRYYLGMSIRPVYSYTSH